MRQHPDFLIIGAMKCATSTLHEQLAVQPGIFMTELKEPNFFSNNEIYARGIDWYLSLFSSSPADALCGESSTHYTKLPTYPRTIERIQAHCPEVKLIYVMRHPIDRLLSQYIHEWSQRVISVDIKQAIDQFPELIQYSQYTMQLEPFINAFGCERILPVFFERLCTHPQEELERVCRFLGYSDKPNWDFDLAARNVSSERLRKSAWRDFLVEQPVLQMLRRQFVPKNFRTQIRSLWMIKKKPELEPQQIEHLKTIFDADLAVLGSWLGIELSCDRFKATVRDTAWDWVESKPCASNQQS